jgi:Dynamin family
MERSTSKARRAKRDVYANEESKIRYEAYSRLQAAAVAFGESLGVPEIVAIGGQSDGKSSLMEAFLGFRFNVREVEMGTRRPLIVQMVHDPEAEAPKCRLQNEHNADYGPVLREAEVAAILKKRTEDHLEALGCATVSSKAMCMRVEYAYCPNLTIIGAHPLCLRMVARRVDGAQVAHLAQILWQCLTECQPYHGCVRPVQRRSPPMHLHAADTPGLILKAKAGETDDSPDAIAAMVKEYITPPHRLVLFLQQSSVEWASSLWLQVIQEVDPSFSRTVMVCSKFDNRMREFKESWEVDKFLSASGYLPNKVKPFFVALPADRTICSADTWRTQINQVDTTILSYLQTEVQGGFDEATFGARIGFGNLRRYLENELARRYRESAPSTLAILQMRCDQVAAELAASSKRLTSLTDAAMLRRTAMEYAGQARATTRLHQRTPVCANACARTFCCGWLCD